MTVSTTISRVVYSPNGSATAFPVPFPFFADSDLVVTERVIATGAETTKVLNTDYTVAGGDGSTGTVTALAPPPATVQWAIRRVTPRTQEIDYVENDPFPASTHEEGLDRAAMRVIDQQEELDRCLKFPVSDPASSIDEVPNSVHRKGKFLYFNAITGVPEVAAGTTEVPVSAFMETVLDDADAAAARMTLGAAATSDLAGYQPVDAGLASITAITHQAGRHIFSDGSSWVADDTSFCFRNRIINGALDVWQRGIGFNSIADGTYCADRFRWVSSVTGAVHDVSRSSDVPTVGEVGQLLAYSVLADCATADAAVAAGDLVAILHRVEGYVFRPLAQKDFTLSFWIKATKTGTYCVTFANSGNDRVYVAEYTVSSPDTWEKKTITVPASPSAGTWNYLNGVGLSIAWALMAGTSYNGGTAGEWNTSGVWATANQVNACDDIANNFRLAGIQLEPGTVATPFEHRPYGAELALCMRYYEQSETLSGVNGPPQGIAVNTTNATGFTFLVPKRAAPTVTLYSRNGNSGKVSSLGTGANTAGTTTAANISTLGVHRLNEGSNGFTAGQAYEAYYTANAEL